MMEKTSRWVLIAVGIVAGCILLFLGTEHFRALLTAGVPDDAVIGPKVGSAVYPLVIGLWLLTGSVIAAYRTRQGH